MMTRDAQDTQNAPAAPPPKRSKTRALVWRLAIVAIILVAMLGLAHYLRHPGRVGGTDTSADAKAAEDAFALAAASEEVASPEARAEKKARNLRKALAGIVMHAADEEGPYNDPANKDPADRRRFLADLFGLPPDYPQSEAAADLAPKGAQVLMVFSDPTRRGERIVLMRIPGDIDQALAAIHNHYTAAGYQAPDRVEPSAQTDQGWLVRFTKGSRERLVYARPRDAVKETLVAVYDEPR
jgi:hypothetical protein